MADADSKLRGWGGLLKWLFQQSGKVIFLRFKIIKLKFRKVSVLI